MIHLVLNKRRREPACGDASGVAQLWREAAKARQLANAAFGERERQQLIEVADALERDAALLEARAALSPANRT